MLTQEELGAIEGVVNRCSKMFVRGLWSEAYCIAQISEVSNQYRLSFVMIYDKFRVKATELWAMTQAD